MNVNSMNLKASSIPTDTLSITDYAIYGDDPKRQLAKVIVSYTGHFTKEQLQAGVGELLGTKAVAVENSFRQVRAGCAVGFVRANREVRVQSENEIRANYKVMSSNILMDAKDKSLWEMKKGAGTTYLARHGHEDLSELVEASVFRRQDVPKLRQIAMASAATGEFVAFVSPSGDMDYGFATGVREDAVRVVSANTNMNTVVPKTHITASIDLVIPAEYRKAIVKAGINPADKSQAKEYWTKLYSYAPEYLKMVIQQVEEGTVA